jgi:hypothetical protein
VDKADAPGERLAASVFHIKDRHAAESTAAAAAGETTVSGFVGAQHEFHDAAFVQGWADRFVPTPPRIALFDLILEHVSAPGLPNAHVVELGLGPGYMARHILERNPTIS